MINILSKIAAVGVVAIAILYQLVFKNLLFNILGYSRPVRSIKDFDHVSCTKVDALGLEGCEDMWLHHKTGFLYMACSDSQSRTQWLPAVNHLNASGRGLTDRFAVLDTRGAGHIRDRIQWMQMENFSGINGDGTINLHGFDVRIDKDSDELRMLIINHRPPFDTTGKPLDASIVGANSTIEHFITKVGSPTMRHVGTTSDPLIHTPNRVAWVSADSWLTTNDHDTHVPSLRRDLIPFIGGGNVVYCDSNKCNIAYDSGFTGPNGLVVGKDGLIYVPSTSGGYIDMFLLGQDHTLTKIGTIKTLPIDNMSVDRDGTIYAAAFPRVHEWIRSSKAPFDHNPSSTILKISRRGDQGTDKQAALTSSNGSLVLETAMEDDGSELPGSTVAVHDAETGRLFVGGVMSPWITICEKKAE